MKLSRVLLVVMIAAASPVAAQDGPLATPVADQSADSVDSMDVALDLASLLHVPPKTAMIVIGNPSIADTTEPRNGFVVVTGKGYGTTNLLALDASGAVLLETMIHVRRASERTLTVLRGAARETYSCTPRCEQTVTLGDAPDFFGGSSGQIGSRVGLATGGAGGGGSQSGGSPN
jgi:hypothetical protein